MKTNIPCDKCGEKLDLLAPYNGVFKYHLVCSKCHRYFKIVEVEIGEDKKTSHVKYPRSLE